MAIKIALPDGAVRKFEAGISIEDIAGAISPGLKKNAVAGKVDGKAVDLSYRLERDANVEIVTLESADGVEVYRHSTAHLMAQALKRLYGGKAAKLGIGPVIENGFYYDVDLEQPISSEELERIEREMEKIVRENLPIVRREVSREEAERLFAELEEPLKLELLRDLPGDAVISLYEQGEFVDLCRGPHLPSTGRIKAFKLLSVAGAYWRGSSDNNMLQRIYGTAFPKKEQLQEHLDLLEEAKKRDHRKIGKELGLFLFSEEAPGMPFYLPKGTVIRNELERFSRKLQAGLGYDEVRTPFMMNRRLWEQSGHWDHYHENMYFSQVDEETFALKPMNCPGHIIVYKNAMHSYRELPIRLAEFGQVAPARAVGKLERIDAGAHVLPGRRPYFCPSGPDRGRNRQSDRPDRPDVPRVRIRLYDGAVHETGAIDGLGRIVGEGGDGIAQRAGASRSRLPAE